MYQILCLDDMQNTHVHNCKIYEGLLGRDCINLGSVTQQLWYAKTSEPIVSNHSILYHWVKVLSMLF